MERPRRAPMNLKATAVAAVFLLALMAGVFFLLESENGSAGHRSLLDRLTDDEDKPIKDEAVQPDERTDPAPKLGNLPAHVRWSKNTQQLYVRAQRAFAVGEYQTAIESYQEALKENPDLNLVHLGLAVAYEKTGEWEPAYRSMKRYVELSGGLPEVIEKP